MKDDGVMTIIYINNLKVLLLVYFLGNSFSLIVKCPVISSYESHYSCYSSKINKFQLSCENNNFQLTDKSFRELYSADIPEWLINRCESLGYLKPTIVQETVLPKIFDGKDVVLQSQTGSGKTLAYAIPILSKILPDRSAVQAVVVVPTRELGLQVASVIKQLAVASPQRLLVMTLVEGSKNRRQLLWAVAEPPHIVVGNPKALQRLVDTGRLRLGAVNIVVLDEVDACLISSDTRRELHNLLSRRLSNTYQTSEEGITSKPTDIRESLVYSDLAKSHRDLLNSDNQYKLSRQTIMCSATIPQRQHFATQCHKNMWTETLPELVCLSTDELVPPQVKHEYVECPASQRLACLKYLIRKEKEEWELQRSGSEGGRNGSDKGGGVFQALVFIDENDNEADVRSYALQGLREATSSSASGSASGTSSGNNVNVLMDGSDLDTRADALGSLRDGSCNVLVSSDLAARGIDVPSLSLVIQMSLPNRVENYIHRSGRAGRLGRAGKVITMIDEEENFVVQRYSNELGVPFVKRILKQKSSGAKK